MCVCKMHVKLSMCIYINVFISVCICTCIYKRTGISISLFPKYGTLYDCGGRNYKLEGEIKEKKKV